MKRVAMPVVFVTAAFCCLYIVMTLTGRKEPATSFTRLVPKKSRLLERRLPTLPHLIAPCDEAA